MIKYNIIFLRLFHFQPKFCIIYIQHFILSIKLCANAAHCATEMFSTQVPKAANEKTNETKMAKEMNQEKLQFSNLLLLLMLLGRRRCRLGLELSFGTNDGDAILYAGDLAGNADVCAWVCACMSVRVCNFYLPTFIIFYFYTHFVCLCSSSLHAPFPRPWYHRACQGKL